MHFPHLFQEGRIGTCPLRNRLIMSLYPTKYSVDSRVNERMIEFYRERARGLGYDGIEIQASYGDLIS
jgi:2,4-dienoyl-CoA reductase-like NADH-dependent reductase (Old Yellow Enzyme family)